MAQRRPASFPKKSARDKAIDQALLAAAKHTNADGGASVIVRLTRRGNATIAAPVKSTKANAASDKANLNTAMAIALAKAGLAPATPAVLPRRQKPPAKPEKLTAPPPTAKKPTPAMQPTSGKSNPPKAGKKPKSKPAKDAKKPKKRTPSSFMNREAVEKARAEEDRQHRKLVAQEGRAERMQDRHKEAARTIANIGQASPDELLDLWSANIARLGNDKSAFRDLARDYIEAIESEWTRRSIIARLDPDYFKWPSTKAAPGNGTFAALDHAEGILGYLGYRVGKTGEASSACRQTLLSRAFEGQLPPINGPDYMREWDRPDSAVRLEKMAVSIASAVKSAKRRRDADYSVAIEHWEEDLKFLHRAYYIDRFRFDWPASAGRGQV